MTITAAHISPIVALIAGVLILIMPRFLNFIVAIYLDRCRVGRPRRVQDVEVLARESRLSRLAREPLKMV